MLNTPKQKLIEKIINYATLDARRNGYSGIDGTLRIKLNRETHKNLIAVWEKIEKEKEKNKIQALLDPPYCDEGCGDLVVVRLTEVGLCLDCAKKYAADKSIDLSAEDRATLEKETNVG